MSSLELIRVNTTNQSDKYFCHAMRLLEASFPKEERRTAERQLSVLAHPDYRLCLAVEDDRIIGLAGFFVTPNFLYFENFCTDPSVRGCGYGAAILQRLVDAYSDRLFVLEVELPTDDLKLRRIGFYKRNGMLLNEGIDHIMPHYDAADADVHLLVMTYKRFISAEEYADLVRYLADNVDINGRYTR